MDQSIPQLTKLFGLMALNSMQTCNVLMQQFWSTGVADKEDIPSDPMLNPLFVGDRFALHHL
jgi:hypothetical protein